MCFYLRNWQVTFLLYTLGVFISEYTAKAFTEPRDYRVVFLIQQKAVFTAFCFRISSAYYFVFVMVFLDLRYFSITMIADNARTIPIPVPITGA